MLDVLKTAEQVHKAVYLRLKQAREAVQKSATPENIADAAYCLRVASDLFDDVHKEIDKFRKVIDGIGCLMVVEQCGGNLQGKYATARGDTKGACEIPSFSKSPTEYAEMCEYFDVPCSPMTRLHFPAVREHISEILSEGKPLPEVIQKHKLYQEAKLVATKRRGDELDEALARVSILNLEG